MRFASVFCCCLCLFSHDAFSCTVWGATGDGVTSGGETLVIKIRDEKPSRQVVKTVDDGDGYAFQGLFTGDSGTFNTGVNEKGLYVGRTTAGSIPSRIRREFPDYRSPERWLPPKHLLKRCASVREALEQISVYASGHPVNYILADPHEVALVECGVGGNYAVRRISKGVLAHTNHYVFHEMIQRNIKVGSSSRKRLNRIEELLSESVKPYRFEDFISMSRDHHDGALESLCREGADPLNPKETRTLAVIGARIPKIGRPELYVRYLSNPNDAPFDWTEWKRAFQTASPSNP